jgi:hypothetical protein
MDAPAQRRKLGTLAPPLPSGKTKHAEVFLALAPELQADVLSGKCEAGSDDEDEDRVSDDDAEGDGADEEQQPTPASNKRKEPEPVSPDAAPFTPGEVVRVRGVRRRGGAQGWKHAEVVQQCAGSSRCKVVWLDAAYSPAPASTIPEEVDLGDAGVWEAERTGKTRMQLVYN